MTEAFRIIANLLPAAALAGSTVVVYRLLQRLTEGRPVLPYEPRRPVPWNFLPAAVLLLLSFGGLVIQPEAAPVEPRRPAEAAATAASIAGAATTGMSAGPVVGGAAVAAGAAAWSAGEETGLGVLDMWAQTLAFVVVALMIGIVLAVGFRAGPHDLGLPQSWEQLRVDAKTGAVAFLAVLLPVYAIQLTLTLLLEPVEQHPLIEELHIHHSVGMMLAAFAAAAVAAPLMEEATFRLVFQGWLERVEDRRLGLAENASPYAAGVLPGLTRGWTPILVSGAVFSAAHLGHGVAPVSLLPLGWTLGYLYQRTHRLAPSVVCHALFNTFSLVMLWLALAGGEQ